MSNVIQLASEADMHAAVKARRVRNAIGQALGRAYPSHPWLVTMSDDGTAAQITCPAISNEYGMVIHTNGETLDVEQKAIRMAGELLERFNVSRTMANFDGVQLDARGNSIHGKAGGV